MSPPTDIRLSPLHAFQIGGGYWHLPFAASRYHPEVKQYNVGKPITYYHVELPNYFTDNIVMEGGAVVESFGNRQLPRGYFPYTYSESRDVFTRARCVTGTVSKSTAKNTI